MAIFSLLADKIDQTAVEQGFVESTQDHGTCQGEAHTQLYESVEGDNGHGTNGAEEGGYIALDAGEVGDEEFAEDVELATPRDGEAKDDGRK